LAAVEARRNKDLVIIARTEALIAGLGHDEALMRAHHYEEAGADCILIHSKAGDPGEILEFARRWDGKAPLVIVPTNYPALTEADVRRTRKIKLVIYANQLLRAAISAQQALLAEVKRAGGIHTVDSKIAPVSRVFQLQDVERMKEQEKRYLR
jgi:2-methylisocitrate lyase-like PEP mutase family enzyme